MIKNILISNLEWMKKDLILLMTLITVCSVVLKYSNVHGIVHFFVISILLYKVVSFLNIHSMQPGSKFGKDQFSWKFIQSLPLTKIELILTMVYASLLTCLVPFALGGLVVVVLESG